MLLVFRSRVLQGVPTRPQRRVHQARAVYLTSHLPHPPSD
jgi:hypothetical protein